ncbi:Putative glutamine amidotransferase [Aquisphaera giovannonii]|uniref:Glutamine amidotransferase n=1 Tax=Aquisphaera giovannonii TaxID=406548 RepID=A0A5B9W108_9BACT|nr:gamma-glutamyl-gamma-aminobutyrate hydrolase family protein [Aquisphaera giovannonii]QEH33620.1 Putative glutamine amidotransferase [Aquisphaera giovannonii]
MSHRPLIGINTDLRVSAKGRTACSVIPSGYYEALLTANALPVMIPPLIRESELMPILEKLDGVVLTGGDDLDPRKMGLSPHPSVKMIPERRELADRLLCKLVQQQKIPTLGIGLGMQELNVVCGGGLFVHLPEDLPRCIPHYDPHGGAHRHTVVMQPKTRLAEIYGPGEIRVNSYHHQGIRKLAPNFRTAAIAPDGLIEAYEGKEPGWWVVGVQWHPENEGHISLDMQLIEAFVAAAAKATAAPVLAKVG